MTALTDQSVGTTLIESHVQPRFSEMVWVVEGEEPVLDAEVGAKVGAKVGRTVVWPPVLVSTTMWEPLAERRARLVP